MTEGDPLARRIAAQRRAVEAVRARHAFELLVLRRLESRAAGSSGSSLAKLLERAEARRDKALESRETGGLEANGGDEDDEG